MKFIVGIDEVGRGPLAGPVTVCVVACENQMYTKLKRDRRLPPLGIDSKKLSLRERERHAKYLRSLMSRTVLDIPKVPQGRTLGKISYAISHIPNKIIDLRGLTFSVSRAISLCIKKLKLNPKNSKILLDGGLRAPKIFINQKTIIKGDEKEKIIAWASILAKVSRDNLMCRIAKKYPKYAFEVHKGYGTLSHRKLIKKYGLSTYHRQTFCKNL